MSRVPSVKGTVFRSAVDQVRRLIDLGALSREEASAGLAPEDLEYLEAVISPAGWYPVAAYNRLRELVYETEGGGEPQFIRERATQAIEAFLCEGPYRGYMDVVTKRPEKLGETLVDLVGLFFDFCQARFSGDPAGSFRIELSGAEPLTDHVRFAGEGVVEGLFSRVTGRPVRVTSERANPDLIVLRGEPADASW